MLIKREMGKHRKEDEVPVKIFSPNGSYWYVSVHIGVYFVARSMLLSLSRVVVAVFFFSQLLFFLVTLSIVIICYVLSCPAVAILREHTVLLVQRM